MSLNLRLIFPYFSVYAGGLLEGFSGTRKTPIESCLKKPMSGPNSARSLSQTLAAVVVFVWSPFGWPHGHFTKFTKRLLPPYFDT